VHRDSRHHDIRVLCDELVIHREFERWCSLHVVSLDLADEIEAVAQAEDAVCAEARAPWSKLLQDEPDTRF
jgi:hypothetical protein